MEVGTITFGGSGGINHSFVKQQDPFSNNLNCILRRINHWAPDISRVEVGTIIFGGSGGINRSFVKQQDPVSKT